MPSEHIADLPAGFDKVRSNAFKQVYFNPKESCIISVWVPGHSITEAEYKADAEASLETMKSLKPQSYIADNRQATFTLDDHMQSWYSKNIIEHWKKTGVKKLAVVLGEDLNHHVTALNLLDQSIETHGLSELRYFSDLESALKWTRASK